MRIPRDLPNPPFLGYCGPFAFAIFTSTSIHKWWHRDCLTTGMNDPTLFNMAQRAHLKIIRYEKDSYISLGDWLRSSPIHRGIAVVWGSERHAIVFRDGLVACAYHPHWIPARESAFYHWYLDICLYKERR